MENLSTISKIHRELKDNKKNITFQFMELKHHQPIILIGKFNSDNTTSIYGLFMSYLNNVLDEEMLITDACLIHGNHSSNFTIRTLDLIMVK